MVDVCVPHPDVSKDEFRDACRFLFDGNFFGSGEYWPVFSSPIHFDGEAWTFTH